jgi:DNA-binding transcriptional LysR family regulator
MNMTALDMEAVQAFVLTADLQSFTRAAEALDSTQSAVSLRIKRLERELGHRLLERTPRQVRLSVAGSNFLEPARRLIASHQSALEALDTRARRLVVGMSLHIVGAELPLMLKRMSAAEPSLAIDMRIDMSRQIVEQFERGTLDAAIVFRQDAGQREGEFLLNEQFAWIASPDFEYRAGESLRLATQAVPCSVRSIAVSALDAAGIPWTEVFVGGGVMAVGAAVAAGLAVAALGKRVAPPGTVDAGARFGLPALPAREVMLYSNLTDRRSRASLRNLAAAIRSTAM